jgi:beta-mannosidase
VRRRTRSLDGDGWWLRSHLGTEAALAAAARSSPGEVAIHAVHTPSAGEGWVPARVPGSVLDDLMRAGEVPDLYHERNSLLAEWVPQRAWTYRTAFTADALAGDERAWLRFEGIDAAGHVFLDGALVASHASVFAPLEVEVTSLVRGGGRHELAVVVEPAPASEPQVGRTSRVRVHKPRMSYGWDFCPRLVHQGLWQGVALIVGGPVRLRDVWARPRLAPDLASGTVEVAVELDTAADRSAPVTVTAALGEVRAWRSVRAGTARVELVLGVDTPAPWWPNGLGPARLHDLRLTVTADDGEVLDERVIRVGFRTIERHPNPEAPPDARPWSFAVNGGPLEILGWNWTPIDALYGVPRQDRLEHLLRLAASSGANLLRVWGGGLIETEAFYDACDRWGLLVWQEFSQSSSGIDDVPAADGEYVSRMLKEAEAIVPLRRNHPSLAIWCGGNELQDGVGPLEDDRSPVLEALHEVVERLDPDRTWLPTSPTGPRFGNRLVDLESDPGGHHDVHGPWEHQGLREHNRLWDAGASLFNGEFGVEGMTNRRAHERLIAPEHRWPAGRSNPVYRHLGDWWINEPLVQSSFGGRLADLEGLRRGSQRLQADGLGYAVEANRRRWPRNGGSIPWQLDESYPNAWCTSVVDHRGEPKPAYHAVRRAYRSPFVGARFASWVLDGAGRLGATPVAWGSDGAEGGAVIRTRVVGMSGEVLHEVERSVRLCGRMPVTAEAITAEVATDDGFVLLDLALAPDAGPAGEALATNRYLLATGADFGGLLDLGPATVDMDLGREGDAWTIGLRHGSGPAALDVVLADARDADDPGWPELDDNGFDLLPGEARAVRVRWADAPVAGRRLRLGAWNVAPVVLG